MQNDNFFEKINKNKNGQIKSRLVLTRFCLKTHFLPAKSQGQTNYKVARSLFQKQKQKIRIGWSVKFMCLINTV